MRITIERSTLLKSLNHVHRVVEKRNTIPILSNALLRTADGELMLKATDLDLEVVERVPAMVEAPGGTTVPAHILFDIVRKLPDGSEILLETDENDATMRVQAGKSHFNLQILPEDDFPELAADEFTHKFNLAAGDFRKIIDRTQFAISTEETRYYLNGIYLHAIEVDGARLLRGVATDGHRLAQMQLPAPDGIDGMPGIIIPRKTVSEVQKLLDDAEQNVVIDLSESKIRFTVGNIVLTSKLIDGTFPDYSRVIPQGNDKELTVDRGVFTQAVDRVSTISSERGRAVKLSLASGQMILSVVNPDSGTAQEEIAVDYDSDSIEIGFNAKYLLDIANQLESETAIFKLADAGSPTLIEDNGTSDALYVLMPMRV
ncbi:MAG: DNA polymerase III subunit beta [Hyphomicrobiales bacterium]